MNGIEMLNCLWGVCAQRLVQRKAEGLSNDKRKTLIKVKITDQILPFKNGTALHSPSQSLCSELSGCHVMCSFR